MPISPQAAEDIKATLSIQQAKTQTRNRNTQRGYTIWSAYQDPPPRANPPPPPGPQHCPCGGPGDLERTIPGRNQSSAPRENSS